MLRYLTAGESHGRCLVAILDGMVAGVKVETHFIDAELSRRQQGIGRGDRMRLEKDKIEILSGVHKGLTTGNPIILAIKNRDFSLDNLPEVKCPRPGHADLVGGLKYNLKDLRDSLERASARETAIRTAVGAICKLFLQNFDVNIKSRVVMIGGERNSKDFEKVINEAKKKGDTVGGIFEVTAYGVVPGLGSYASSDRRLDARLTGALMSIQAIKGVEIGMGFRVAERFGREVHDEIFYNKTRRFFRRTNNAGGIEGGVSNGEPILLRCAMKPLSTLLRPLRSVDIKTKKSAKATVERSDICAVWSAGVVAEAVVAFELASAYLEKFGGDSVIETSRNFKGYIKQIRMY